MGLYTNLVRPALFLLDPERAKGLALQALRLAGHKPLRNIISYATHTSGLERKVFGLTFPNPVGLAAGLDKNAEALLGIQALGFGFAEVGTVLPQPQAGNDRPRLFRLREDRSIINRMGFNSDGAEAVLRNLKTTKPHMRIPVGVSIGKNKDTPLARAARDHVTCVRVLYRHADFFIFNPSSPNTPGLRDLQAKGAMTEVVTAIQEEIARQAHLTGIAERPLLIKTAPDLGDEAYNDVLQVITDYGVAGVINSNTTIIRPATLRSNHRAETGGLSGPPLFEKCIARVAYTRRQLPSLPIIASGGFSSADDVKKGLDVGASLVQIFTALIYEGPFLPARINRELARST